MINRTLLRIKVLHIVYSFYKGENRPEKELLKSLDKSYELYFYLLQLAISVTHYAQLKLDARKNRLAPTPEDLNPNRKFVDNRFIKQLSENIELADKVLEYSISWDNNQDIIKSVYESIISSEDYKNYMGNDVDDYLTDKAIWRKIYKDILPSLPNFNDNIEDLNIYWIDSLDTIMSFVLKTIKRFQEDNGKEQSLIPKFKDEEDLEFAIRLLNNTINSEKEYREIIDKNTQNWEIDRIAFMDIIIMQIAISELTSFPSIPINVTLNEYIEISKYYSTDKSATFINGVLDKIITILKNDKKLIKIKQIAD